MKYLSIIFILLSLVFSIVMTFSPSDFDDETLIAGIVYTLAGVAGQLTFSGVIAVAITSFIFILAKFFPKKYNYLFVFSISLFLLSLMSLHGWLNTNNFIK